ncbi:MAG: bifunctional 4-hydroxy-2-oxoglutarate aldolase/2-dehydro-3-deoxy-phosphogluconate aldolase [Treponemataceae bacterium]
MKNLNIFNELGKVKIIPVVVLEKVSVAEKLGEILMRCELPCAEVTFRTDATVEILKTLRKKFPSMLLGAGTVLSNEKAEQAFDAGASFAVSPGFDTKLVEFCLKKNFPIIPGVATASEIQTALSMGLTVLKFFPAAALGGVKMLKALSAPFKQARFVPTGGITKENIVDFLALPSVLACGGTWLVKKDLLEQEKFDDVEKLIKEAVFSIQK